MIQWEPFYDHLALSRQNPSPQETSQKHSSLLVSGNLCDDVTYGGAP